MRTPMECSWELERISLRDMESVQQNIFFKSSYGPILNLRLIYMYRVDLEVSDTIKNVVDYLNKGQLIYMYIKVNFVD